MRLRAPVEAEVTKPGAAGVTGPFLLSFTRVCNAQVQHFLSRHDKISRGSSVVSANGLQTRAHSIHAFCQASHFSTSTIVEQPVNGEWHPTGTEYRCGTGGTYRYGGGGRGGPPVGAGTAARRVHHHTGDTSGNPCQQTQKTENTTHMHLL